MRIPGLGILVLILAPLAGQERVQLDGSSYEKWRDFLAPTPEELAWQKIGWHAELGPALKAARAAQKPVLLWAMNGHPLGCV